MFNFTTQSVYNSIVTSGKDQNLWTVNGKKPAVRLGNTRFDADKVLDIQKKLPTVENLASVTFDMSKIAAEATDSDIAARIVLYIGLSMNSQDSFYANDFVYKGKPFYVEFPVKKGESANTIAKKVKAIADKYLLFMTQEKVLDVSTSTTAADNTDPDNPVAATGTVTFTGVNGYQQIKVAKLQKFDPNAKSFDCCNKIGEFVDVIVGVPAVYTTNSSGTVTIIQKKMDENGNAVAIDSNTEVAITPGIEAFGDYNWIIHNLRLPTAANTNFWAPTKNEMPVPVPGAQYVQFIVRVIAERDGIAGEVVGQRATSVTNHVFYVIASGASTVENALGNLIGGVGNIKKEADAQLQEPYNVSANSNSGNNTGNNENTEGGN